MKHPSTTADFPVWSHQLGPMKARFADAGRQLRPATLAQLEVRLGNCLPGRLLAKATAGPNSRERVYSLPRIFWGWLWQMLNHNAPCREVVRQVQALSSLHGGPAVDEDTGGYCQARTRLPQSILEKALTASAHTAAQRAPANQKGFPQPANQKRGCGFPVLKLVVLFCLTSGALLARATGTLWDSEARLLHRLLATLKPGDVVLGDRGFGNFVILALLASTGVDLLARVPTNSRRVDFRRGRRLGRWDRIVFWHKGPQQGRWLSPAEWAALPEQVTVRIVRLQVRQAGFRTRELTLATTLLDAQLYPAAELLAGKGKNYGTPCC